MIFSPINSYSVTVYGLLKDNLVLPKTYLNSILLLAVSYFHPPDAHAKMCAETEYLQP